MIKSELSPHFYHKIPILKKEERQNCRPSFIFYVICKSDYLSSFLRVAKSVIPETASKPIVTTIASEPVFGLALAFVLLEAALFVVDVVDLEAVLVFVLTVVFLTAFVLAVLEELEIDVVVVSVVVVVVSVVVVSLAGATDSFTVAVVVSEPSIQLSF